MAAGRSSMFAMVLVLAGLTVPAGASAVPCPGADPCPYQDAVSIGQPDRSLLAPLATTVDDAGNLYVFDLWTRIVVRAPDGTHLRTLAFPIDEGFPYDLAVSGGRLFAATTSNRIVRMTTAGTVEAVWGAMGTAEGQFDLPPGIAVAGGSVYVVDQTNNRVQVFDEDGAFQRMWGFGVDDGTNAFQVCTSGCQAGVASSADGGFSQAGVRDVAVAGDDVFVLDAVASRVQRFSPTGAFEAKFGAGGQTEGQFSSAVAIAADAGKVLVADDGNARIQRFAADGSFERMWGFGVDDGTDVLQVCTGGCQKGVRGRGEGQISSITGFTAAGGRAYVADFDTSHLDGTPPVPRVERITADGVFEFRHATAPAGELLLSGGVAIAGDSVYVSDPWQHAVRRYARSGEWQGTIGAFGTAPGSFAEPGPNGLAHSGTALFVADGGSHRIQRFSSGGVFERTWGRGVADGSPAFQVCTSGCQPGTAGSDAGELWFPGPVAFDNGRLFVGDIHRRVSRYSADGAFERTWGFGVDDGTDELQVCTSGCLGGTAGAAAGQFGGGVFVAAAGGKVYASDGANNRISRYSADGAFERTWGFGVQDGAMALQVCTANCQAGLPGDLPGQLNAPAGLAVAGDRLYVADTGNHRVSIFSTDGTYLGGWGEAGFAPGQLATPQYVAADGGDVVVSSFTGYAQRFCLAGPCDPDDGGGVSPPPDVPSPDVPSPTAPGPDTMPAIPGLPTPPVVDGNARLASRARVRRGRAEMPLRCAPPTAGPCAGTLTLFLERRSARRSQRTRKVRIGRAAYRVPAGRTATIRVRLSRGAQAQLRRRRSLRVRAELLPRGQRRATVSRVVLRAR